MNRETGARIREARKTAGLSQEKLAKAVEGLSASALSKAEHGEKALSSEQLEAIARALGVPSETLLADVEAENVSAPSPAILTPEERELLAAYRAANAETKKVAVSALWGRECAYSEYHGHFRRYDERQWGRESPGRYDAPR